jgi:hypothetical protein
MLPLSVPAAPRVNVSSPLPPVRLPKLVNVMPFRVPLLAPVTFQALAMLPPCSVWATVPVTLSIFVMLVPTITVRAPRNE